MLPFEKFKTVDCEFSIALAPEPQESGELAQPKARGVLKLKAMLPLGPTIPLIMVLMLEKSSAVVALILFVRASTSIPVADAVIWLARLNLFAA
jgi:hypothetical protein